MIVSASRTLAVLPRKETHSLPKLLRAVELPNRKISLLLSLPRGLRADLQAAAHRTKTPVSDLLQSFLDWGWEHFAREELLGAMAVYRYFVQPWHLGQQPNGEVPDWLRALLARRREGEQGVVFIPHVTLRHWAMIAPALERLEAEFYDASLSDAMTLFFACSWTEFERSIEKEKR
jgi:hypothetical protein